MKDNILVKHLFDILDYSNHISTNVIDLLISNDCNPLSLYSRIIFSNYRVIELYNRRELLYYLLGHKSVDINCLNLYLLCDSVRREDFEAIRIIIEDRKGNINPQPEGFLMYSYLRPIGLSMNRNNFEIVKFLLEHGSIVCSYDLEQGSTMTRILNYVRDFVRNNDVPILQTGIGCMILRSEFDKIKN